MLSIIFPRLQLGLSLIKPHAIRRSFNGLTILKMLFPVIFEFDNDPERANAILPNVGEKRRNCKKY